MDSNQPALEPDPLFDAKVLRAFVREGRLVSIPAQHKKRQVILRWLAATCFTEDRAYPEKELNMRLALVHPDFSALRRYLVISGLMSRAAGSYRLAAPAEQQEPAPAAS